jgi:TolA-binding protein
VKRSFGILNLVPIVTVAVILFSCSSTPQRTGSQEFFEPLDTIVRQQAEPGAASRVVARTRSAAKMDDQVKDAILDLLEEQNKRLDEVSRRLNAMTEHAESSAAEQRSEHLRGFMSDRNRLTNELLSEAIKDQNQRLNEIIGHLNTLLQNQHSAARTETVLIQVPAAAPASSPKRLDASLNYGKAIQLYQSRQYEKAIRSFKRLLNRSGDPVLTAKCRFWMGVCHFNLGRLNEALSAFREVLKRESEKAESARFMIGQCYERMGEKKLALEAYEEMMRRYPAGKMKQIAEIKLALLR